MKISKILLAAVFSAVLAQMTAQAQLVTYSVSNLHTGDNTNHSNVNDYITPTVADSTTTTASNYTIGLGIVAENSFGLGGYANNGQNGTATGLPTSLSAAEADNTYLAFTVAPTAGNDLSISGVDFSAQKFFNYVGTSDYTYTLEYSLDGFATAGTVAGSFTQPGNTVNLGSNVPFTLSDVAGPVDFRLYANEATGGGNLAYVYNYQGSFAVNGTVSAATTPEPSTYALLGLGLAVLGLTVRNRRASV